MFLYIVPVVVFLVISLSMYSLSRNKEKNKSGNILIRNILPAIAISVLVFVFMKYRETMFNQEPMMGGNYFDN
jgi:cell division protein FtsW (lipid II flippase)